MSSAIKVLIIDDDEVDRLQLKRALKNSSHACDVVECEDMNCVTDEIFTTPFDCIFLDYLLPGENGLSLLKKIRDKGIGTPIVIITSQGSESIAVELMKAGASDYLVKDQINGNAIGKIITSILRTSLVQREKEEAVRALQISEKRLAEAQKIAKIGNWEVDIPTMTMHWSEQVFHNFELNPAEFHPTLENYISSVHPSDQALCASTFSETVSGKSFNIDIKLVVSSGEKFLNVQGYPVLDENNVCQKIFGTSQDITDRKRTEQELLKATKVAEDSLTVREVFLANMSHEIRTPMNAVIGFTQLLYDTQLSEEQKGFVDAIHFSGDNLLVIINDILDLSKMQSGKMRLEKIDFNLNDLLKSIITSLRGKAENKGLQLSLEIGALVPSIVNGDPVRLNQVLTNLINNAVKFTERGYVHLKVEHTSSKNDKQILEFSVKDSGIGIPHDKHSQIFESFVQASSETSRKYGGTGLGLTIVKNIIELHGGTISFDSTPGYGSTFYAFLPFAKADHEILQIRSQEVTELESIHFLKTASILVAEDNHVNRLLIKRVLDKTGCKTDLVFNGAQCVESVKTGKYDLVLMDIQMPEMDGYAATKHIRTILFPPVCNIPIIAMTAHALTSEVDKCISIGMNDYVSKPFKQEVLFSKMEKLLRKSNGNGVFPQEKSIVAKTIIDLDPLYRLSNGSKNFVEDLRKAYEKQTPDFIERLRNALQKNDSEKLHAICIQIKTSYGIVQIPELNKVILEIMTLLDRRKLEEFGRLTTLINTMISLMLVITDEVTKSSLRSHNV